MSYLRSGFAGLGACSQADPNAGNFASINCPWYCYVMGNVLDTAVAPQSCWPCSNVCPAGTCWDTTNLVCSATPATTNVEVPVSEDSSAPPAPVDCTQTMNYLFNSQCGTPWGVYMIGGIALLLVGAAVMKGLP